MTAEKLSAPFDAADYLQTPEEITAYLNAVLEEGDEKTLLVALEDITRAANRISPKQVDTQFTEQLSPDLNQLSNLLHNLGFELSLRRRKSA